LIASRSWAWSKGFSRKSTAWAWKALRAVRGHDYDRQRAAALAQRRLQLDPARARQPQVGKDAAAPRLAPGFEERLGIGVERDAVAGEPQHERKRIAHRRVVVDDVDGQALRHGSTR
jgi:hypothetical protein